MAKNAIPDPLKRRHLVEEALPAARALAVAEAYLDEGRGAEAIAFLEKAEAWERLEALRDEAVESGDLFLVRTAATALGEEPSAELWTRLAERAEAAGKERYAHEARRQAQRGT